MDSKKYYEKLETMAQDFLYRNFKDYKDYEKMRPASNPPARFHASAKTNKFDNINLKNLKFLSIINATLY